MMRLALFNRKGSFADVTARYDVLIEKLIFASSVRQSRRVLADAADRDVDALHDQLVVVARTRTDLVGMLAAASSMPGG
jgi:hypothetical protein